MHPLARSIICVGATATAALAAALPSLAAQSAPQPRGDSALVTLRAGRLLDGRGGVQQDAIVTVRGGRIESVSSAGASDDKVDYDLRGLTVLPGLVDAHVHLGWYINRQGALHRRSDGESAEHAILAAAGNAYVTLMAGVTTVQGLGGPEDVELRDAIARGLLPGPRILTSIIQLSDVRMSPDSLRAVVRMLKTSGADVVKLFASSGLGAGGEQTLSDEQLRAACGEASAQGLRSVVHAISAKSIRAATLAGCTQIEHGLYAGDAELHLMAERGTYFDPQVCLVFQNYLEHREEFGHSGFTQQSFEALAAALPTASAVFARAIATPGLKVAFGTDAVALAHGQNARELQCRVQKGGQKPMDAIVSATSLTARSLGLGDRLGAIAPGLEADLIAVEGDPLRDVGVLGHMAFVMRHGTVYKYSVSAQPAR